jgi:hypothetical protein
LRTLKLAIRDQEGSLITNLTNTVQEQRIDLLPKKGTIVLEVPNFNLESGDYLIDTFMATDDQNSEILDFVEGAVVVNVNNSSFYSSRVSPPTRGSLLFDFKFEAEEA